MLAGSLVLAMGWLWLGTETRRDEVRDSKGTSIKMDIWNLRSYLELQKLGVDLGVQLVQLCDRRDDTPLEDQNSLDHSGNPGCTFKMADICFERTTDIRYHVSNRLCVSLKESSGQGQSGLYSHQNGIIRIPPGTKCTPNGHSLKRVTCCRPCTMGLEEAGVRHVKVGLPVGCFNEFLLHLLARQGEGRSPVLIRPSSSDDGADGIAVSNRGVERFDDQDAETFASAVPIGAAVKAVGYSIWGKETQAGQRDEQVGREEKVATGDDPL